MIEQKSRRVNRTSRLTEVATVFLLFDKTGSVMSTTRCAHAVSPKVGINKRNQTLGSHQSKTGYLTQGGTFNPFQDRDSLRYSTITLRGGSLQATRKEIPAPRLTNTKARLNNNGHLQFDDRTPSVSNWSKGDVCVFQASSFLYVLSLALVAFSPAPALIAEIGSDRATAMLSIIAACAALTEIIISPALGSVLDSVGRKPALMLALFSVTVVHGLVSIRSSVLTICVAKFVGMLCLGSFFTASQVIISDISASDPKQMSSTLGIQYALIGCAYFVGAISAGRLSTSGLSITYGSSMVMSGLTTLLVGFRLRESLLPSKRIPYLENKDLIRRQLLQSPWSSCTRILFRHSTEVRVLAILIMIQNLPMYLGETFQILVKSEWDLDTKDFSSFVAMIGIINIVANIVGSQMVVKIGIKYFTLIATLSSTLAPIAATIFSFCGLILGSMVGFLGSAQTLGVTAAIYAEGEKSNISQGELAGERSAFLALAKVIGPIWYSMLYVKGKNNFGSGFLPFYFNTACGLTAVIIGQRYLPS